MVKGVTAGAESGSRTRVRGVAIVLRNGNGNEVGAETGNGAHLWLVAVTVTVAVKGQGGVLLLNGGGGPGLGVGIRTRVGKILERKTEGSGEVVAGVGQFGNDMETDLCQGQGLGQRLGVAVGGELEAKAGIEAPVIAINLSRQVGARAGIGRSIKKA